MSYILDAIRKSESERRRGEVPDVLAVQTVPAPPPPRSGRWLYMVSAVALFGGAAAGAAWWAKELAPPAAVSAAAPSRTTGDAAPDLPPADEGKKRREPASADAAPPAGLRPAHPSPAASLTAPPVVVSPPPGTAWALTPVPMLGAPSATPSKAARSQWAEEAGEIGITDDEMAALLQGEAGAPMEGVPLRAQDKPRRAEPRDRPAAKPSGKPEPAWVAGARADLAAMASEQRGSGGAAAQRPRGGEELAALAPPRQAAPSPATQPVPAVGDLPAALRSQVPPIALSLHLYVDDPAARRVRVNNQSLREGEPAGPDLQVAAITRDGVVFRFKGTDFFVSANDSWQPR